MRAKSKKTNGYTIYAVSGVNTVSFAIDFREANTKGLLGFALERIDIKYGSRKYMDGYKVFKELIPNPDRDTVANTYTHPVQSFVWDDFTCYDNTDYEYLFYPLKGTPKKLDRSSKPISVKIKTEQLFSKSTHDIFFNRGVASSQAYRRRFFNLPPDKITNTQMKKEALDWLSRHLDDAILKFIAQAKKGDTLLGCFYEFHYEPVVKAFKEARDRGVNVKIIIDAKKKITKNKKGEPQDPFPREENIDVIKKVKLPLSKSAGVIYKREAKKNNIQHNKFIVYIDSSKGNKPTEVWGGSTNISLGGIHGQTNVGHWVRDKNVAEKYKQYWDMLCKDPGGKDGDTSAITRKKNSELKKDIEKLQSNIEFKSWDDIPKGITPVFSPRGGLSMLNTYVKMFDNADNMSCITLAFGINQLFKDYLIDNTKKSHISLMLLEKEDKPSKKSKKPFVNIGFGQNVYKSWGARLEDDLYQWAKETSTRCLKLNHHVAYVHSKFLLVDPLSNDPVVVTGSANFSKASTNDNDENMIIIRGDRRAADIYFTEFNRLFNHYYFRAVYNNVKDKKNTTNESIFLDTKGDWLKKYHKGKFRYKRVEMLSKMEGYNE